MSKLHYDLGFGLGMAASKRNAPRIPAADNSLMRMIEESCKGKEVGSSIPFLKGWIAGYEWQTNQLIKALGL